MYLNVNAYFPTTKSNKVLNSLHLQFYPFSSLYRYIILVLLSFITSARNFERYIYILIFAPFFTRINNSITKFRLAEFAACRSRNTRKINASNEKRERTELKEILVVLKRESVERNRRNVPFYYPISIIQ